MITQVMREEGVRVRNIRETDRIWVGTVRATGKEVAVFAHYSAKFDEPFVYTINAYRALRTPPALSVHHIIIYDLMGVHGEMERIGREISRGNWPFMREAA